MTGSALSTLRLLRIDEVSTLLGVARWRLYALNQQGLGPPSFRLGRVVVFPQHLLAGWIEAQAAARPAPKLDEPTRGRGGRRAAR